MPDLDDHFALYSKGAYQEAYRILRDIIENQPRESENGDQYLWYAHLELLASDNVTRAHQLLDKARALGCSDMAFHDNILGYVLWRTGDRDAGLEYLEKSVALDPSISNLKCLAVALSSDGNKRTINICERILEKDPKNCMAYACLGIEAGKSGNRDRALLMAKRAESLASTPHDFFQIGALYRELGQFNDAVNAYLEANSRCREPWSLLYGAIAACYALLGDCDTAIEYATRALDLDFNQDHAKDVLLGSTEQVGAKPVLSKLRETWHGTCLALILTAQEAVREKNNPKVYETLSKAKQLEPSPTEMYYMGRLYHSVQCFDKALDTYFEAEKLGYPETAELCGDIARCYLYLQKFDAAIQYAIRSIRIDYNNDSAKDVLSFCLEKEQSHDALGSFPDELHGTCFASILLAQMALAEKNLSNAGEITSNAELLNPSPAEMYHIGHLWYQLGTLERALGMFLKAEKCGYSDKARLYGSLADCYYFMDDYDSAIQYATMSLALNPDDDQTKEVLYACRQATWGSDFGDNY